MGCQCWQKLKCKLRRKRSHGCGHVNIPLDEEDDEMKRALLLLLIKFSHILSICIRRVFCSLDIIMIVWKFLENNLIND